MAERLNTDICVIGAGSGGLTIAAIAAGFGVDTVLIERDKMGGDCLNYGCVPSKALLAAGKAAIASAQAEKFGIYSTQTEVNFEQVHAHVHAVIDTIAPTDSVERFTGLGVKVIEAEGRFISPEAVVAGSYEIHARRFVIATGSSPFVPPINGLDTVEFFTNETIFDNTQKLPHLIIVGGGPIGLEMAQAHHRLGSKVTVLEADKALANDDPELTRIVLQSLRDEGLEILEGHRVEAVAQETKSIALTVSVDDEEKVVSGSHLLVAVGRSANISQIGLELANVEHDGRKVAVNKSLRTTNKRVYAVGDIVGGPQFTHTAGYHAVQLLKPLLFRLPAKVNHELMPWTTYTDPELSHVGLSEEVAREKHKTIRIYRWPFADNDRAVAERKTIGHIKVITKKNGQILGADIVGANAGELIAPWALAISNRLKLGQVAGTILPYPTLSEVGKRAAALHFAPSMSNPWVRRAIAFLRKFG